MNDRTRVFNSYKSLFRINFKIYEVGGKMLPRAIPLDALFMSIILFIPLLPFGHLFSSDHPWIMTLILSGGASWALIQMDPQGKLLPVFVFDFLCYAFRPKTTNLAGRPIRRLRKHHIDWKLPEVTSEVEIPFSRF